MNNQPTSTQPNNDDIDAKIRTASDQNANHNQPHAIDQKIKKSKLPKLSKKQKIILFSILGVLLIGGGVAAFVLLNDKPQPEPVAESTPPPEPPKYYASLSGKLVDDESKVNSPVTAIMIENLAEDARPQSGLKDAEVVFEAIAEGGITRFMALYQLNKPKLVGPVRSLRPYYIDWLEPFDSGVAHVGGSEEALRRISNGNYLDLDQSANPNYFWRTADRVAPHNMYTSFAKMDELNKSKQHTKSTVESFKRQDPKAKETPTANTISMKFGIYPSYDVSYKYNPKNNTYLRSNGSAPHMDREKGQIEPDVVIGLLIDQAPAASGYLQIKNIGSGTAFIFQNGDMQKVTWKKPSAKSQIKFYNSENKEVALNRGKVWLSALPNNPANISWK